MHIKCNKYCSQNIIHKSVHNYFTLNTQTKIMFILINQFKCYGFFCFFVNIAVADCQQLKYTLICNY